MFNSDNRGSGFNVVFFVELASERTSLYVCDGFKLRHPHFHPILSNVFSMCQLHILLFHHCIVHGGVDFLMP